MSSVFSNYPQIFPRNLRGFIFSPPPSGLRSPVPLLKLSHAFSDQVEDLPVGAPALVFGNVVQLIMQFGVNLDSEMLVLLVSHKITSKPSEYKYILSQPSGVCAEVYLL